MKLITNELAFMFLSIIIYPLLHSVINFCLKICFQQAPNFGMSMGQRYRYQRIPPRDIGTLLALFIPVLSHSADLLGDPL